jgi:uncharacterized protein (TIGR02118 family)
MTVKANVHYGAPTDPGHFESYFVSTHAPLVHKIAGLRTFEYGKAISNMDGTPTDTFWIATLTFDSMEDMQKAMGSPEGQATVADMGNYASGGATVILSEVL